MWNHPQSLDDIKRWVAFRVTTALVFWSMSLIVLGLFWMAHRRCDPRERDIRVRRYGRVLMAASWMQCSYFDFFGGFIWVGPWGFIDNYVMLLIFLWFQRAARHAHERLRTHKDSIIDTPVRKSTRAWRLPQLLLPTNSGRDRASH
jgi:hypothetical protein